MPPIPNLELEDIRQLNRLLHDVEMYLVRLIAETVDYTDKQFYRRQYRDLARVRAKTSALLRAVWEQLDPALLRAIRDEYAAGLSEAGVFASRVNDTAISALAQQSQVALATHLLQVQRSTVDVYQRISTQAAARHIAAGTTQQTALRHTIQEFADKGITGFVNKAGRQWEIDTYSDMVVRTVTHRARTEGYFQGMRELGVELVKISTHPACAPQCQPFQGRVLALSGPAGPRVVVDHKGDAQIVQVVATMKDALAKGYKHPNCRHRETAFLFGDDDTSPVQSTEELTREYKIEQQQRYYERQIRKWRRHEALAVTEQDKRKAKAKIAEWEERNRIHVAKHGFLTRYKHREELRA